MNSTNYVLTQKEHTRIINALNTCISKHYDLAEDTRIGNVIALLKKMKPNEHSIYYCLQKPP